MESGSVEGAPLPTRFMKVVKNNFVSKVLAEVKIEQTR